MKTPAFLCGIFIIILAVSCLQHPKPDNNQKPERFSQGLTQDEVTKGLLSAEILWKFGRIGESSLSPDKKNIVYGITRYNVNTNKGNTDLFIIPVNGGEPKQITNTSFSESNARWKPDGSKIGFLSPESGSVQLWEMKPDGSDKLQISKIEGGINSFEYAPTGARIYYTKQVQVDKSPSDLYPDLPLAKVRIYDDLMVRHWNDWNNYQYSHIFIANIADNKITNDKDIMSNEAWDAPLAPYFEASDICWSPDGKFLAYTSKKLHGKEYAISTNSDVYLYNLETGSTINFTDGMPGYDRSPVFSPDGKFLAWTSMATAGYEADKDRLFIKEISKGKPEYLTENFDQWVSNPRWSDDGKAIYFISGLKGTVQLFSINIGTRQISQITRGVHDYTSLEIAGDALVASRMSMSQSTEIYRVDPKSGEAVELTSTNKNIFDNIKMGKVKERWVKTTDKKDMLVWVVYPPGFDSTKRYPAVLFCEGGPQDMVSQFFSYRWNLQLMAANGYIVIAPNRRGLPGFGQQWNDEIAGDYGGQNIRDYLSAVDDLKKEKYVDGDHLGAVGASYGGYSVYYLAGHHEKRFKAFIAHCGMFNFESFYGATEELWFPNHDMGGSYWQNPPSKSYAFSPHKFVDKWDTPIMIITGEYDFRIPYTESLQAFTAARLHGIPSRLLVFPEETHFVLKPQNSILWQREFFAWLDKYLKH
jgi:dipeptidyl aminopeptidase/acylaminoacyl peptidase